MATETMDFYGAGMEISAKGSTGGSHSFHARSKVPTEDASDLSEPESLLDEDAEALEDDELDEIPVASAGLKGTKVGNFESGDQEELSEEEDSDEDDDEEPVGAVKMKLLAEDSESAEDAESDSSNDGSGSNGSSEVDSDAAPEWDAGSDGAEDKAAEIAARNNCM